MRKNQKLSKKEEKLRNVHKQPAVPGTTKCTFSERDNSFNFPDLQMTVFCKEKKVALNDQVIREMFYFPSSMERLKEFDKEAERLMADFKKLHRNKKQLQLFSRKDKKVIVMRSFTELCNTLYDMISNPDEVVAAWKET